MKWILFLLPVIVSLGCSEKINDPSVTLDVTYSNWHLTRTNSGGGIVNLQLKGSTNGDRVTVRTYGDGLISDRSLGLDSKNNFNDEVPISFTATSVPSGEFEMSTIISAFKGMDTLNVTLKSGKLKY